MSFTSQRGANYGSHGSAVEPVVERPPRPREPQREDGTQHQENHTDREHVRVHGVGHRCHDPCRSPYPQVFERVADEQPDEREDHAARRGNPDLPLRDHVASIRRGIAQACGARHNWRGAGL